MRPRCAGCRSEPFDRVSRGHARICNRNGAKPSAEMVAVTTPYLDWIERESAAFAAAITDDSLARAVPSCPGWDQWTLVGHLGNVQRFWALDVRAGGEIPDDPPDLDVREPRAVQSWFDECTRELLDAL